MNKKTIILGASPNPDRYSNKVTVSLKNNGYESVPVGFRSGVIAGLNIQTDLPIEEEVDTITLYLNPTRQKDYYEYIFKINPKRIIFNPGTENPELIKMAKEKGIEPVIACTLVMLSIGDY